MFSKLFPKNETELEVAELTEQRDKLETEVKELTEQVAELELKAKISEEDIKHMIKMREEKLELEAERKEITRESAKAVAIAAVKDEYRDKLEAMLNEQIKNIRGMYDEILKRLPDVNVALKGNIGGD